MHNYFVFGTISYWISCKNRHAIGSYSEMNELQCEKEAEVESDEGAYRVMCKYTFHSLRQHSLMYIMTLYLLHIFR